MRRVLAMTMGLLLMVAVIGCGAPATSAPPEPTIAPPATTEPQPTKEPTREPTLEPTPEPTPEVLVFGDAALEAKVRAALDKPEGDITVADAESVTQLDLHNEWQPQMPEEILVRDIGALAQFRNLTSLDLSFNAVTDVTALAELTKLEFLSLGGNNLSDVSPLAGLTGLLGLQLWGSRGIDDISALAGMERLTTLAVGGCQISDISVVANMRQLEVLDIVGNQVTDLSPLAGLPLSSLRLNDNPITDWSPIEDLYPTLEEKDFELLSTEGVPDEPLVIEDPQFEAALRTAMGIHDRPITLRDAFLAQGLTITSEKEPGAQFSDISPLAHFPNLTRLAFNSNLISDLSPLSGLSNLTELSVGFNQVADLTPLAEMVQLEKLELNNNQIIDVSPLAGLVNLHSLTLRDNPIEDFSPLEDIFPSLQWKDFELE
jgi:internalin A